jgi:hypothetical protein
MRKTVLHSAFTAKIVPGRNCFRLKAESAKISHVDRIVSMERFFTHIGTPSTA